MRRGCCFLQYHVLHIYFSILNRQYKSVGGRMGLNSCPWYCLPISSTLDMNWASVCAVLYCPLVFMLYAKYNPRRNIGFKCFNCVNTPTNHRTQVVHSSVKAPTNHRTQVVLPSMKGVTNMMSVLQFFPGLNDVSVLELFIGHYLFDLQGYNIRNDTSSVLFLTMSRATYIFQHSQ